MTLQDILLEQQIDKMNRLDTAWARFQAEAAEIDHARNRGPFAAARAAVASGLVHAGVWIDRHAGERALTPGN
ncbi:MAG: hypothetical protein HY873_14800 [Chloroflexi bacterium]|nr:hypothetical protein [Chloroflexota bacterium]